jgi:(p)ppGpp synthase/HD superfamily hydrolase
MTRHELEQRLYEKRDLPHIVEGIDLVQRAREYALQMHGDQKYGDEPYSVHLEDVETILIEFNHISSVLRAAAWLHDLEDPFNLASPETDRKIFETEFHKQFNNGYLFVIVEAVSVEPGKNRKIRNKATYEKIAKYEYAIILKLADRISNGRKSKANDSGKFAMYKKEYPEFRAALFTGSESTLPMWAELDRLFNYQPSIIQITGANENA